MNVAVVNLRDIIKYLVKTMTVFVITFSFTRYFAMKDFEIAQGEIKENIETTSKHTYLYIMDMVMPDLIGGKSEKEERINNSIEHKILGMELKVIENIESVENGEDIIETVGEGITDRKETIELAKSDVTTEVVQEKNMNAAFTNTYNSVQIRNKSDYELTSDMLVPDVVINKDNILIVHTHTCESYTPTDANLYKESGNYRTTDLNYSVAKVGDELKKQLTEYRHNVIHDTTYHDYPAYTGSYDRSEKTIRNVLEQNKDIQIVFDIHRDAVRKRKGIRAKSKNR